MARQEEEREDLLKKASAFVSRAEIHISGGDENIVAGFRRDGSASFYFAQNVVYQFNAAQQLRRIFLDGRLYKALHGRLIQLTRHRTQAVVEMIRHELTPNESARLLADARQHLQQLSGALSGGDFQLVGQVSPAGDLIEKLVHWLGKLPHEIQLAQSPGLR